MQYLAVVVWLVHWFIRFAFALGVPIVIIRRTWDSSLVRLWFAGTGFTFLSQKVFFSDCPLTILELILRDGFAASGSVSVDRIRILREFIAWGIPYPAHVLFVLALVCVALCTWAILGIAKGAKKL